MRITNKNNLPQPIYSAILNNTYDRVGDISVTGLIQAPRQRQLQIRHNAKITEDASDRIWMLLGSAVHAILEWSNTNNHLPEERMTVEIKGWKISGKPDLLEPDYTLSDYKVTSVWAFILGEKIEWEQQCNFYAWLYGKHNFEVTAAQIVAFLRDWQASRAKRDEEYPQVQVIVKRIPLWDSHVQENAITERVMLHQAAEAIPDDDLPDCTAYERWARPDSWAIKKKGGKRATKVFFDGDQAKAVVAHNPKLEIEYRPGMNVRCESYCNVKDFCSQFAKIKGGQVDVEGNPDSKWHNYAETITPNKEHKNENI